MLQKTCNGVERGQLYCIDLTVIYECAKMPLVAGPFMVSGAVQGCDLSHTFTHRLTCFPTHWPHGWHTCSSVLPQSLKASRQLCSSSSSVTQQDSYIDNWQGSQHKTWSRHKLQVAALIYTSMEPLSKLCSGGKEINQPILSLSHHSKSLHTTVMCTRANHCTAHFHNIP